MDIQQKFELPYQYKVLFSRNIFQKDNDTLRSVLDLQKNTQIAFFIDQGVATLHPHLTHQILAYFNHNSEPHLEIVPGGEIVKNSFEYVQQVLQSINTFGIDRHSYVIAMGGGAVLDMVGFAASIAHRGVRHIRIPTTVLAQNDSGVGVKNGINFFGKKNFLGTFSPPVAVINDALFLTTLEERDWRSGISEALKVALLKDPDFYYWLEENASKLNDRDLETMEKLIFDCAGLHVKHISGHGDPFELGSSRPLDFGHWSAHKMEQLSNFQLRHGEAVALGISLDVTYASFIGLLNVSVRDRILQTIPALGLPIFDPIMDKENHLDPQIYKGLQEFQEHLGGRLTITLIKNIGEAVDMHQIDPETLDKSVRFLKEYQTHAY